MSLKQQTVSGIKWQVVTSILQKIISFAVTIVLARLLDPSTFGLFAFGIIVAGSFELFKTIGIDSALLQRNEDFDEAANTAFFIIPCLGLFLYVLLYFSAPYLGVFLNNADLVMVVRALGLMFVITSFTKVSAVNLAKHMEFKYASMADFYGGLAYNAGAVILALMKFGIWSLVYAYLFRMIVYMAIVLIAAKWIPKFTFNLKLAFEMLNFGKYVFFTSILLFLKTYLDNILVGKLLGTAMLGFYAIAFNIANIGSDYFGSRVSGVVYPAFTRLCYNVEDLRKAFLKVLKYVSVVAIPLGVGLFLLASEFLKLAYGNKWIGAIPILKILAWGGIFSLISLPISALFLAMGKPRLNLWGASIQVSLFFGFIIPAAKIFGVNGVAVVVSLAALLRLLFEVYWIRKSLAVSFNNLINVFGSVLLSSLVMFAAVEGFKYCFGHYFINIFLRFSCLMFVAVLPFAVTLYLSDKDAFNEIKQLVKP